MGGEIIVWPLIIKFIIVVIIFIGVVLIATDRKGNRY